MKRVLLAGESWMSYTTHVKGFDSFIHPYMRQEKNG
ncbi:MAG: glutamine amidotransferase [Enterocloster bolteae]